MSKQLFKNKMHYLTFLQNFNVTNLISSILKSLSTHSDLEQLAVNFDISNYMLFHEKTIVCLCVRFLKRDAKCHRE